MKRLLEGDGSEFERGLLDALKVESPGAELEQRMRDALGLGPIPAVPPPTASPVAPAAKTFGGAGAIAAGAVVAALFVGGGIMLKQRAFGDVPTRPAPVNIVTPSEPAPPAPTPAVAPETRAPDPVAVEEAKPRARKAQTGSTANAQSLREEIRLIDSARVAVKKQDSARALGILDRYEHRFPAGAFQEEARVLRREALKNQAEAR